MLVFIAPSKEKGRFNEKSRVANPYDDATWYMAFQICLYRHIFIIVTTHTPACRYPVLPLSSP